jgi:hypothetical protein
MRSHTVNAPVSKGADFEIDDLHRTEGPFHSGEVLICLDRMRGAEVGCWHAGGDDIDAVEFGLSRDLIDLARFHAKGDTTFPASGTE